MVATICSEGSRELLPTRAIKNWAGITPLGGTEALEGSSKTIHIMTINTFVAPADNKVLSKQSLSSNIIETETGGRWTPE